MIMHCSLWKFKDGTSHDTIEAVAAAWRGLKGKIPAIRGILVGVNVGDPATNHDIAACIYFDSFNGYRDYVANPLHDEFASIHLLPNVNGLQDRAGIQFEISEVSSARS